MSRTAVPLILVGLLAGMAGVPWAAAQPDLTVTDAPSVVVANDPETMSDDPETEEREFNPDYVFSVEVRIVNDGDERTVRPEAIIYADPDTDGCPQEQAFFLPFVQKRVELAPDERAHVGGSTDAQTANSDPQGYWPMALSEVYRDAQTGQNVSIEEGDNAFCTTLRTTGEDPACDKPTDETCIIATAPFESYVRIGNEAPAITSLTVNPENPRPGQRTLLSAEAIDNSSRPHEDDLTYTWSIEGETKRGANVQHTFPSQGVQEVRLEVTDGFDTTERTVQVPVGDVPVDDGDGPLDSPGPGAVASLLLLALLAALRRRR